MGADFDTDHLSNQRRSGLRVWRKVVEWPKTVPRSGDSPRGRFGRHVPNEPVRVDVPSRAHPGFEAARQSKLDSGEMVLALSFNHDARAYPVREIAYHHIVNDVVGGVPVAVTY